MIKNILFDLDGTLFSFAECEKLALKSSFKEGNWNRKNWTNIKK